jgi:phage terminase small subunit
MSQKKVKPKKKQRESRERPLTDREEAFCREVIHGSSYSDAYTCAGYRAASKDTAYVNSSKLLRKAKIQARLRELRKKIAEKYDLTEENIFKHTGSIATSDIRDFVKWGPGGVTLKGSGELTEAQALAVEEVSETQTKDGGTVKFKLHSKTRGIEIGAKLLGMLVDKKEVTGKDGQKLIIEIATFAE